MKSVAERLLKTVRSTARFALTAALAAGLALPAAPAAAQEREAPSIVRDAEIEAILREDSEPIFRAAGLNPDDVRIHLVQADELNAFVSGGQQMFLYTGMILETEDPSQLQGVIAHETGHIAGGHSARSGDMQRAGMVPFLLTLAVGVLAAVAGRPDAGAAIASSGGYFATLNVLTYSRGQEAAADQAAASYLETAGLTGRGLTSFFRKFRYQEVFSQARRYPYFQSHPISSDRIAALETRVNASPHRDAPISEERRARHTLMKVKLEAFLRPPSWTYARYREDDRSFNARYARAIAYYRDANLPRALTLVDALIAENPQNPYLQELKGQMLFENGRTADAEAPYRRAVELLPDNALLQIAYAQVLVALGGERLDPAIETLRTALRHDRDNLLGWRLLGQAYDAKGMDGQARLAAAEEHFNGNDFAGARLFALRARQMLTRDTPEYRRAGDIIMASGPSERDIQTLAEQERAGS